MGKQREKGYDVWTEEEEENIKSARREDKTRTERDGIEIEIEKGGGG